jgi:hypothetical protein
MPWRSVVEAWATSTAAQLIQSEACLVEYELLTTNLRLGGKQALLLDSTWPPSFAAYCCVKSR